MHRASHYRNQAELARRLALAQTQHDIKRSLHRLAQDFDEIAEDLEVGAIEFRHPELMPQRD